ILLRVAPDAAPRPRWNADRLVLAQLDDVIPELELQPAGDHKVDLLLRPVPVPVRALAARVLRHAPIRDRDLLSADRVRDPPHLAGVIAQPVLDILDLHDLVLGHLPTSAMTTIKSHGVAPGNPRDHRFQLTPAVQEPGTVPC